MTSIFTPTEPYSNFTFHHWFPLLTLSLILSAILIYGNRKPLKTKHRIIFILSLIPAACVLARMVLTTFEGLFSIQEELPLHLCRLIALVLPFLVYTINTKWINTLYFLIVTGTLQALITADLQYIHPHYSYYLYWIFHITLLWIPVFIIMYLKIYPNFKDLIRAFIATNVYMIATLIINKAIGSNYFYTNHKPPGGTLLDYLGPWPIYIFVVEGLGLVLFLIAYLPFVHKKENRHPTF